MLKTIEDNLYKSEVFTVGGNIVEIADEYKYLGFIFNTFE